jgi:hypothetical protein
MSSLCINNWDGINKIACISCAGKFHLGQTLLLSGKFQSTMVRTLFFLCGPYCFWICFWLFVVCFCTLPAYPSQQSGFTYSLLVVPIVFIILASVLYGGLFVLPHDFLSYLFIFLFLYAFYLRPVSFVSSHWRVLKNDDPHYWVLHATSMTKFYLTVYYF